MARSIPVPGLGGGGGAGAGFAAAPAGHRSRRTGGAGRPAGPAYDLTTLSGLINWDQTVYAPAQAILRTLNQADRPPRGRAASGPTGSTASAMTSSLMASWIDWFTRLTPEQLKGADAAETARMQALHASTLSWLRGGPGTPLSAFVQEYGATLGAPMAAPGTSWSQRLGARLKSAGGQFVGGLASGLRRVLPFAGAYAAGEALVGLFQGTLGQGWSAYQQQATALSPLVHSLGATTQSLEQFRERVNEAGLSFGYSLQQITGALQQFQPYVGTSGGRLLGQFRQVLGFGFAEGIAPSQMAQAGGMLAQMGFTSGVGRSMTTAQFLGQLANAMANPRMQGRQTQVLNELLSVTQNLERSLVTAPNPGVLLGIINSLNSTGVQGLQGQRGAALLNQINQGILSPGGGTAGQALMMLALNPTGQLSWAQTMALQQYGLTGQNPVTGQSNWSAVMQFARRFFFGGRTPSTVNVGGQWMPTQQDASQFLLFANWLGLTVPQAAALMHYTGGLTGSQTDAISRLLRQIHAPANALQQLLNTGKIGVFAQLAQGGNPVTLAQQLQRQGVALTPTEQHLLQQIQADQRLIAQSGGNLTAGQWRMASRQLPQLEQDLRRQLAQTLVQSPNTLQNSIDQLNSSINKAQSQWSTVASKFTKAVQTFYTASEDFAKAINRLTRKGPSAAPVTPWNPTGNPWVAGLAQTTAYNPAGVNGLGVTLASWTSQALGVQVAAAGGVGSTGPSSPMPAPASQAAFLKQIAPYVAQASAATGLPAPLIAAQWAFESGWGTSAAARMDWNLAGIKPWAGARAGPDPAYAGYHSLADFTQGYIQFLEANTNYRALLQAAHAGAPVAQLAALLTQSGYAGHDATYGQKVLALLQQIEANTRDRSALLSGAGAYYNGSGL
ncbi:MAG: glucosaminidase domain-containing protein [Actinomycetia bacterium]|nr:glucosaminidase domain-containing protein [Actinomycetes bacterium]